MTTDTLEFPPVDTAALDNAQAKAEFMAAQQLAIIETGVAELTPTARALAELKHRLKGIAYPSLNTGAGMQAAIDDRRTLIDLRVGLGKLVEAANKKDRADTKARCDQRDAGCLKLTTAIKALEEPIDQQIKAEETRKAEEKRKREAAEAERKAKHEEGLTKIRAFLARCEMPGMTAERVTNGITMLEAQVYGEEWEEYRAAAEETKAKTLASMRVLRDKLQADEAAAAEAERVRKENEELRAKLAAAEAAAAAAKPAEPPAAAAPTPLAERLVEVIAAEKIAAGGKPAEPNTPQQGANRDASAGQSHVAEGSASPAGRGADGPTACGAAPVSSAHAVTSALQAAPVSHHGTIVMFNPDCSLMSKSGPVDEKPTLKLGDLNDWLKRLSVSAAQLEALGFTAHVDRNARLYKPSDKERIRAALIEWLQGLA